MSNIVKNTTFIGLLDLLAPHSCRGCGRIGEPLCNRCKNYIIENHQNLCPLCHQPNSTGFCENCPDLPPIFITGRRADLLGDLVQDFKYHSIRALARPLAEILNQTLPETAEIAKNHDPIIIVPLPTISKHIRERGFSHTHLVAKHLAHLRHCRTEDLLTRAKNTVQVGADQKTRRAQAAKAYALKNRTKINPDATYLLLDDVWTTGASMQAAYRVLEQAGAKHIAIAILALSGPDQPAPAKTPQKSPLIPDSLYT